MESSQVGEDSMGDTAPYHMLQGGFLDVTDAIGIVVLRCGCCRSVTPLDPRPPVLDMYNFIGDCSQRRRRVRVRALLSRQIVHVSGRHSSLT